ncbi:uncharacterized protein LAJ45_09405 [Morchella importuna]|uniref:uncharacterized protein n=1 Tax=Morchella importuna TaxID=1174673 RepID=UPI001E8D2397|nr:uncharacterized protein LAJ45_09405 [Morchella importuna]KAH8146459.1 hypothetical protein LAJ45_09405 [Morchella importuna]
MGIEGRIALLVRKEKPARNRACVNGSFRITRSLKQLFCGCSGALAALWVAGVELGAFGCYQSGGLGEEM